MNKLSNIYPWQTSLWHRITAGRGSLHHALLMHGRAGIGKYDFALQLSKALLCSSPNEMGQACNTCASCHWFDDDSHPDFRLLTPEQEAEADEEAALTKKTKKKTQISVAQIRELNAFLSLSSHQTEGLRIVLIHPAESLNQSSANALLKMLEEPAAGVVFILVAHQLQRLLPTVRSRCQKITMPVPTQSQSLEWLNIQGIQKDTALQLAYHEGSPVKVLSEQTRFAALSEIWNHLALGRRLEPYKASSVVIADSVDNGIIAVQKWLYDILTIKLGQKAHYHLQHERTLQALADKVNLSKLFELQKKTNELRKLATHPLNQELQMESLLTEYTKAFQS